jgi:hypothetical protein
LHAFQTDGYRLSGVYGGIRSFKTGRTNLLDDHLAGRPRLDHIDSQILSVFQENEFHSVQPLAQETKNVRLDEEWLPAHESFNSTYFCEVLVPDFRSAVSG